VSESLPPLATARLADLDDAAAEQRWLVRSLWARAGVGILGGAPKCCKSWLALDVAVSVASATPALGHFQVDDPGPVVLFMAEDPAPLVKQRAKGIAARRSLGLDTLPRHLITEPALRVLKPRLLVLDPFVRLHRIDENDAGQVAAVLGFLRELQRRLDLAVLVVHHARKNGSAAQAGQNLRGSSDLHAWGDSNLYLKRKADTLTLGVEHRAAPAPQPINMRLDAEHPDTPNLQLLDEVSPDGEDASPLDQAVLTALQATPMTRTQLRAALRVRNERLGDALARLHSAGDLVRNGDRWRVPVPNP